MHGVELPHIACDCAAITLLPQRNKSGGFGVLWGFLGGLVGCFGLWGFFVVFLGGFV